MAKTQWGLVKYGSNCDFIGTSHLSWAETVASQFAYQEASQNQDVREYDHSHPVQASRQDITGPSGLLPGDLYTSVGQQPHKLLGDVGMAAEIQSRNHQYSYTRRQFVDMTIIFNVYDQQCSQIIQFNSNLILNVTPW